MFYLFIILLCSPDWLGTAETLLGVLRLEPPPHLAPTSPFLLPLPPRLLFPFLPFPFLLSFSNLITFPGGSLQLLSLTWVPRDLCPSSFLSPPACHSGFCGPGYHQWRKKRQLLYHASGQLSGCCSSYLRGRQCLRWAGWEHQCARECVMRKRHILSVTHGHYLLELDQCHGLRYAFDLIQSLSFL